MAPRRRVTALSRQIVKRCDLADFDDPALLDAIRELLPDRDARAFAERKTWEYAMLVLFLREVGRLHDGTEALAVGAGDERPVFWLANHAGRVVATDIYGEGRFADQEGAASMLDDPRTHAPFPYRENHLEVRWMDGRELDYPDATFDVVFSLSSIEHFGTFDDIECSAREMARVLRPGGHAFVTTECFIGRARARSLRAAARAEAGRLLVHRRHATVFERRGAEVMTVREVRRHVVDASGLTLLQPFDLSISPTSFENVAEFSQHDQLRPRTGVLWPHIVIDVHGSTYTSIALAFEKPAAGH
jgi:SAM-dependent methyltransferase